MRISFLTLIVITSIVAACNNTEPPLSTEAIYASREESAKQLTSVQWIDSVRNFGKIMEGQKLAVSFRFKNTGDKPLVIISVEPACGCTVADYPKQPIKPGEEGEITGEFNSQGRPGQQHKTVTVKTNTPVGTHVVAFEVNVVGNAQNQNN